MPDGKADVDALHGAGRVCARLHSRSGRGAAARRAGQGGKAVHSLQRAIRPGTIGAKHGRSAEQMQAISRALTLLTNIVMAWNTQRIQSLRDQNPDGFPDDIVARLAPIAHAHINMRGVISFHLDRAAKGLIVPAKAPFVSISR